MAVQIRQAVGKVTATYKDQNGDTITEPLSYTNWNLADSQEQITTYSENAGQEVTLNKSLVAESFNTIARNLASLTDGNIYTGTKINYEVQITETT